MVPRRRGLALASGLLLLCFITVYPPLTRASEAPPAGATIRHHDLFVQMRSIYLTADAQDDSIQPLDLRELAE